ncbi:amino acid ABC transporter permease [Pseudomonas sp. NPDC089554]|uniref:amino acid ABC transporter permease n=1 Tax=Pseudomonas sp. NPDC089554 TaxID=3390653 RepID=UPI003D04C944
MLAKALLDIVVLLLQGVVHTLYVTLTCFMSAFALGLGVAALRRLSGRYIAGLLDLVVFIIRPIPVLVLLFLVYFGLPAFDVAVSPLLAMNLSLGVIGGAYLSEVFRGALAMVEPSETSAARAAGFSAWQIIRHLEFPQMLRFSVPGVMNELTAILKNTPFAYMVGIAEILGQAKALTALSLLGMNIYLIAGLLYFLLYRVFVLVMDKIEQRYAVR